MTFRVLRHALNLRPITYHPLRPNHPSTLLAPHATLHPSRRTLTTTSDTPTSSKPIADDDPLPGTVPYHQLYIFLHTPNPPSTYPAKFATPVQRHLLMATMPLGGSVNFAWSASEGNTSADPGDTEDTTYRLTAFSRTRGKLEINHVSLANVDQVGDALRTHTEPRPTPIERDTSDDPAPSTSGNTSDIHLYVCTHGAWDCRCGMTGSAVADAIRAELHKRQQADPTDPSTRIKLSEVAHVGGHKYAANVLVYPHGEWLGRVKPENVPAMIDAILERPTRPMHPEEMPICPSHWRGRMGLNKEEQIELFTQSS